MELILRGQDCGFTWAAAHLLPGHFKCSRMHGHNYVLDVEIKGKPKNGMIVDFVEVKKRLREAVEEFDHKLMLPEKAENMVVRRAHNEPYMLRIDYTLKEEELDSTTGEVVGEDIINKKYYVPIMDTVIVADAQYITAETLAEYFKVKVVNLAIKCKWGIPLDGISVIIYEAAGQGVKASYNETVLK